MICLLYLLDLYIISAYVYSAIVAHFVYILDIITIYSLGYILLICIWSPLARDELFSPFMSFLFSFSILFLKDVFNGVHSQLVILTLGSTYGWFHADFP